MQACYFKQPQSPGSSSYIQLCGLQKKFRAAGGPRRPSVTLLGLHNLYWGDYGFWLDHTLTGRTPPWLGHQQCQPQTERAYINGPYWKLTFHILFVIGSLIAMCMWEMPMTKKCSVAFSLTLRFKTNEHSSLPTSTTKTPYLFLPTVTFFPIFQVPIPTPPASIQRPGVWHIGETHPTAWL